MELGTTDRNLGSLTPGLSSPLNKHLEVLRQESCVICLDRIDDKAVALPCLHDKFHFACLGTWLQQHQTCPLCKGEVYAVRYVTEGVTKIFHLPQDESALPRRANPTSHLDSQSSRRRNRPSSRNSHLPAQKSEADSDPGLAFRREVYARNLYSLYVGSNRYSRYLPSGSISPDFFARTTKHVSRARTFIRRELRVFDFLDPPSSRVAPGVDRSDNASHLSSSYRQITRATNREYLLDYIIAILQAIPLKGSEAQAEKLLADFLGMENAKLFCHELEAWLRSPFERLAEWDSVVQYKDDRRTGPGLGSQGNH